MAQKIINARAKNKRDTSANWTANDPVLLDGEIIIVDTADGEVREKIGDGIKTYTQLPFSDEKLRNLLNNHEGDSDIHVTAEEKAAWNSLHFTTITIPAGRMRGDVDGDGYVTDSDGLILENHLNNTEPITDETQLLCADANGDGAVNSKDKTKISQAINGIAQLGSLGPEVTGNWANNPNYATEEAQFYTDISITGMTAQHSASVIVQGSTSQTRFTKAECMEGVLRIYATACPIADLKAVVEFGLGDGSACITQESTDLTAEKSHIADGDIHVTAEQKAAWSESDVFIAKYGTTTNAEIEAAYQAGKAIFLQLDNTYPRVPLSIRLSSGSMFGFIQTTSTVGMILYQCAGDAWSTSISNTHASTHATGGSDPITPASIGAAPISTTTEATLSAASWSGNSAPYTYTLTVNGVTDTSMQEIVFATSINLEQLTAGQNANIQDGGQSANTIVLKAWGEKPTVDLPIRVIMRG